MTLLMPDYRIAVAPMLDWTDRHCRYFLRLISQKTQLYTEMVTTGAILHGDKHRHLAFDQAEQPLVLQLGGSCPQELAACAKIAVDFGYQALNLNVGCPSNRVQSGRFGACLMAEPELVAAAVAAMRSAVSIPVTVKTRIGIDDRDSYAELVQFIQTVAAAGCQHFIMHARKAWLKGLSPKENREIPPLRYDVVYQLKQDFPQLTFSLNGGITSLAQAAEHLQQVDGVMIGRAAYHNPYMLAEVDQRFYQATAPSLSRHQILLAFLPYVEAQLAQGVALKHLTKPILGLFQGLPGARAWRRYLSEHAYRQGAGVDVIQAAAEQVQD